MTKKIISIFMAVTLVFGVFGLTAFAGEEPSTEVQTGVVHKMSEIMAAYKAGETYLIQPGDTIELDNTTSVILIVDYLTDNKDGSKSVSDGGYKFFRDNNQRTGYTVKAIGETTTYADIADNTDRPIDFSNPNAYAFKSWKVTYAYSESNFNQVKLTAVWDIPVLEGWAGFLTMARSYLKTVIDYFFAYFSDLSKRMIDYFG